MKNNLLMSLGGCVASTVGVFMAHMEAQQGQPGSAPGGTPSQQPQPSNPSPRPASPAQPGNNQPGQPQPAQPQPAQPQPGQTQPGQDRPVDGQPTPLERNPGRTPLNRQPGAAGENPRFFSFSDPTMEARFRESATRLSTLERGMTERNQRLVQRLGDVRRLPADRQNAAVMDLLQDILQENAQLQQYLSQSRTLVTGDIDDGLSSTPRPTQPRTNTPATDTTNPATSTPRPATPGSTSPSTPPSTPPATNPPR